MGVSVNETSSDTMIANDIVKPNDDMKSLKQCLQTLVTCAGGNGNLLFNVGPTADGVIEARQVERLQEKLAGRELELTEATRRAQEAQRQRSQLLANVSH